MKQYIRSLAVTVAVLAFFLIAGIGACSDVDPLVCGYRGICGAIFVYVGATIALRLAMRIVVAQIISNQGNQNRNGS
ncbi:hypothetical protein STSP2_00072 [Anaerohalosphaera lusitana]|uniref:Lipoprotein n=1 Tax=Anaerohalosphaera lusitana TaxID=1936003 RepID=A0A1U9NGR9_9BACT|nr:hypothetical protein [Anaerohalosphaera lusitana]AQT66934.1 hypothetical protein STSP2_00072 [Anaerohalosphaera lusitana]